MVYRSNGDKIGTIARVMIEKITGKVAYAVMSFGGFMGIGQDYSPLPWNLWTYNPQLEGYEFNIGDEELKDAPKYGPNETWDWNAPSHVRSIDDYWALMSYVGVLPWRTSVPQLLALCALHHAG
jgi:hypothetical protein